MCEKKDLSAGQVIVEFICPGKNATIKDRIDIKKLDIFSGNNFQDVIIKNTIFDGSGLNPESWSQFEEVKMGNNLFYKILTGRFEGSLSYSYYLVHGNTIYDFSFLSHGVDWTNPNLDQEADSTHIVLKKMLETLEFIN